jgi:hypothetical protein
VDVTHHHFTRPRQVKRAAPDRTASTVSLRDVPDSTRRLPTTVAVVGAAVVLVAAVVVITILLGGDDDDAPPESAGSTIAPVAGALGGDCENLHAGHGIAMWNPTMADEMTAAGCPWPYEPFIPEMEGGEEDPSIAAPFEPHLYDDLTQVFAGLDLGLCQVATLGEDQVDGLAFGFRYAAGPPGCPNMEGDVALTVREYGTRAWRDASANASTAPRTLVLGRWAIGLEGDDAMAEQVAGALVALGAVETAGPE